MTRFVSPPIDHLDKLRQPLTQGEVLVFDFFNKHLPEKWEIYIQPHLNGLRPDFVLLNPDVGIAVFEVKDWNFDAMTYAVKLRHEKSPKLIATKDGKQFSLQNQNPIEKINQYKQEINELYCPRINMSASLAVITAGVIFPFAKDQLVKEMFWESMKYRNMTKTPQYYPLSGADSIKSGNIEKIFPEAKRKSSQLMSPDFAQDLRSWLVEPDFSSTQRKPLRRDMDKKQLELVNTRTDTGYRRIKGPAGSGKSLVLAARAAQLISEGKDVLVVTFNITLCNYLRDLSVRWHMSNNARNKIVWLNFHSWCKRVCIDCDREEEYTAFWRQYFETVSSESDIAEKEKALAVDLPKFIEKIISGDEYGLITKFDAVLVDEGQDFLPTWWNLLRSVCRSSGEMLLVADATQDIYDTARSWTDDAMTGAGFRGDWAKLEISYRLPPVALEYARKFAERFLPSDNRDLPVAVQAEFELYPCNLRWVQTTTNHAHEVCMDEILQMSPLADPILLSIPDITFLCGNQKTGQFVVKGLGSKGVKSIHTYSDDDREARRKKMGFYMGDARVKATTLHSFKGWESRAIVIYVGKSVNKKALALIYTGLTRLKRHEQSSFLTVVSCADELRAYGKTWPTFIEI